MKNQAHTKAAEAKKAGEKAAAEPVKNSEVQSKMGHEQSPSFVNPDLNVGKDFPTNDDQSTQPQMEKQNDHAATGNEVAASNVLTEDDQLKKELDKDLDEVLGEDDFEPVTLNLKVKKGHPNGSYRLLDKEIIGYQFAPYELNQKQFEDLITPGPMAWIECQEYDLAELKKQYNEEKAKL